jgi:cobalt-zinc-cadmium efflux system membrane fusion protein
MKWVQQGATAFLTLALAVGVCAGAWWLITNRPASKSAEKPVAAAQVKKVVQEDALNTVVLTEKAEERIGLKLAPALTKPIRRVLVYGGEVTIPVGRSIIVSAPLSGTLKSPGSEAPKAGGRVRAGQTVYHLTPLLTPDGQATLTAALADANGQVNTAKASLDLAVIALQRAERVLKEGAGSQRQVDEARAALDVAKKTFDAATARQTILKRVVGDAEGGTAAPNPIDAPQSGILRTISALPGQTVPNGAALFEVADLSTVWIRVPLPVGDLETIDLNGLASVGKLSARPGTRLPTAKLVVAPPSANPLTSTVDVYYELPNAEGKLIPGQRLGVSIPLADSSNSLIVPWSAIVFDVHGNTWAYVETAAHSYTRIRVVVKHSAGEEAVLASGPTAGTKVVIHGAEQLFGAETGFIK